MSQPASRVAGSKQAARPVAEGRLLDYTFIMGKKTWFFFLWLMVAACGDDGGINGSGSATPAAVATPLSTAAPAGATPVNEPTAVQPPTQQLTFWTTPEISPRSGVPGGDVLAGQLAAFRESHPEMEVRVELKSATGQGSILNYLRTGQGVAPGVLPDLVLLPAEQLPAAVADELIYPLDQLLPADMVAELYPAAQALATVNEQLAGYPFALTNLQHASYDPAVITGTLPATWEGMAALAPARFVFPAAGVEGAELALQLYLAIGGSLTDAAGNPVLEAEPLALALNALSQGRNSGVILFQSGNVVTLDEAWEIFQEGSASVVETKAGFYLNQRANGAAASFAPLPGVTAPLRPMVRGLVLAITTADPARQARAAQLLTWLAAGPNVGDWTRQSFNLPARRSAFEQWPADDPYIGFLQAQLEQAVPFPTTASSAIMTALSAAVFDVISLAQSPQVAAEEAAAAIQP